MIHHGVVRGVSFVLEAGEFVFLGREHGDGDVFLGFEEAHGSLDFFEVVALFGVEGSVSSVAGFYV